MYRLTIISQKNICPIKHQLQCWLNANKAYNKAWETREEYFETNVVENYGYDIDFSFAAVGMNSISKCSKLALWSKNHGIWLLKKTNIV